MRKQNLTIACLLWLTATGCAQAQDSQWQKEQKLGHAALDSGDFSAADDYLQKAIKSAEQLYGPDDSRLRTLLHDLADAYKAQKKYPEAEAIAKREVEMYRKDVGDSPDTADQLVRLAKIYALEGKNSEAEAVYEQALPIYERFHHADKDNFNDSVAYVLNNLGSLYTADGKYSQAEALLKRSLAIREGLFGPNSLEVASTLQNYADLMRKTNRIAEADQLSSRAKTIQVQP